MSNSNKILVYLDNKQAGATDIAEYLGISRQAVHRTLNKLLEKNLVQKTGIPPKVYYTVNQPVVSKKTTTNEYEVDESTRRLIDNDFMYVTASGQKQLGWNGFVLWCEERRQNISKMARLYLETKEKYDRYKSGNLINGMSKLQSTFDEVALDEIFYIDFYSVEIFGKTKLGQLLLFAKQSQDISLMKQLINDIRPTILNIIKDYSIDGVAFIPPTVKREQQLMKQLEKRLALDIRTISLVKVKTPIIIPQKTLTKLEDRVTNARETIIVGDSGKYSNILLIDDALGSGATLNEVAKKIRQKDICSGKIIGLAVTGSVKGFDVISEV